YLLGWYVAPSTAWPAIAPLVPPPDSILVQPEGEWGERQAHLFKTISAPSNKVVLIASDSPQIELETVLQSFAALTQSDLVLGPTYDGGYWLIGMRGSHDLLTGLQMSGPDVLNQLLARAERLKLDVTLLPATFDIDVEEDLVHLREVVEHRSDLMATRAALIRLGLLEGVKSR
ncbi:MAG: DUF2064 domain-containing protein, partial [Candidatus Dormibacteraceae bacterium]